MGFFADILYRRMGRGFDRELERMVADAKAGKKPRVDDRRNPESGVISLVEGVVRYDSPSYGSWSIPVKDIAVFGEYTTDNGPWIDDWFMVFVTGEDQWLEASNYCAGQDEFRRSLAAIWNIESAWGRLWGHTDFASRVIWPQALADRDLFEFTTVPQKAWEKVKSFGTGTVVKSLKPEVLQHVKESTAYES